MRMIDADELERQIVGYGSGRQEWVIKADKVDKAPTVEAIPIDWKLFPETTPRGLESYLVTYLDKENKKQVTVGCLMGNRWYYKHNNVMERIEGVMAFAKLPEPYKCEEAEKDEGKD